MAGRERSRSVSALNRLIFLVILIPVAVISVLYFTSPTSPFHAQSYQPAPINIGQIRKQFKIETAEVTTSTLIDGSTFSALPFSKENYVYQVVITMTAGIDMTTVKDSDIVVNGDTVTVRLPEPQVLRVERGGQVVSHSTEFLSGVSSDKNLLDKVQNEGQSRIVKTVLEQGKLMQDARQNAEDDIRNTLLQAGAKTVVFVQANPTATPTAIPTGPPR